MLYAGAYAQDSSFQSNPNNAGEESSFQSRPDEVVSANTVADPNMFPMRSENNGNAIDSRSKYYTNVFNMGPETHGEQEEFEGMYLIGTILGFVTTGLFMIFGFIVIVADEVKRHETYSSDIAKLKKKLEGKQFECTVSDMKAL
jgi:hypothetical protein